jgi:hypothetical protein
VENVSKISHMDRKPLSTFLAGDGVLPAEAKLDPSIVVSALDAPEGGRRVRRRVDGGHFVKGR